jgi:hypothetical protein
VLVPLLVADGPPAVDDGGPTGLGPRASGSALTVQGAEVSAVIRDGGQVQVRVFNPRPEPVTAELTGRTGWRIDLRGRPLAPFEQTVALGPWEIATLAVAEPDPPPGG